MAEYRVNDKSFPVLFFISEQNREKVMAHLTALSHPSVLNDQFVDMKFITRFTGLTDKWFYKLIQEGTFPKPIKLGRSSRWLKSDVEAWVHERIAESRAKS